MEVLLYVTLQLWSLVGVGRAIEVLLYVTVQSCRVATAQGKQGIWFLLFPDRENTGNLVLTQGKIC